MTNHYGRGLSPDDIFQILKSYGYQERPICAKLF
jgi:hypothetical protein